MKKLLTYLSVITCFSIFSAATPCSCNNHLKISEITLVKAAATNVTISENVTPEFHPLDILALRFR